MSEPNPDDVTGSFVAYGDCPAGPVNLRPPGTPALTDDGRPLVPDGTLAGFPLWSPSPPRDGDVLYCQGAAVATFHADGSKPGGSYLALVETARMPPELAEAVRRLPRPANLP